MRCLPCLCLLLCSSFISCGQKTALYLQAEWNTTLYDATKGNNPWGMGVGATYFLHCDAAITPVLQLTADAYLQDDKLLRTYMDGSAIKDVRGMVNFIAGAAFAPGKSMYLSVLAGPSYAGGAVHAAIKPGIGFFFLPANKMTAQLSFMNVFNRDKILKEDFGSLSISVGVRL